MSALDDKFYHRMCNENGKYSTHSNNYSNTIQSYPCCFTVHHLLTSMTTYIYSIVICVLKREKAQQTMTNSIGSSFSEADKLASDTSFFMYANK